MAKMGSLVCAGEPSQRCARGSGTVVQAVASSPGRIGRPGHRAGRGCAAAPRRAGPAWQPGCPEQSPGARGQGCCSPRRRSVLRQKKKKKKGKRKKRGGPRRGLLRLVNLFPLPFNPPPGRLSFQDLRGCKPFEVHQHGEVLLYFRSPRFIPGRGSRRPGRLLRSLGLPRWTRGRSDTRLRGEGGRELGPTGRES